MAFFLGEAYGLETETVPPIDCLQSGNPSNPRIDSTTD